MAPDEPLRQRREPQANGSTPGAENQRAPVGYTPPSTDTTANNATQPGATPTDTSPVSDRPVTRRGRHPGDRYISVAHRAPAPPAPEYAPHRRPRRKTPGPILRWLMQGQVQSMDAPYERPTTPHTHAWWRVMCLTGVDYFSTLGYQPGIAALAAGALAPIATLVLVLVTLCGALPMYRRVAAESPRGDGSISMLEHILAWWQGKIFVLCLIGFVATGFVITITLSAADASAHLAENPYTNFLAGHEIATTLALISLLGVVFLRGFSEAIGIAVALVATYLLLNVVVVAVAIIEVTRHPQALPDWQHALFAVHSSPLLLIGAALLLFPKLALGLSGFETGVVVMPLVSGDETDTPAHPTGRIRNTRKLLTTAASIMSVMLLASSVVTILLIPAAEFAPGGRANGRALAYLAHQLLGDGFGSLYDISTISILWFAGASAMAGLLNIVPRYLPRYGMAPAWAAATRPLTLIFTLICFMVTIIFKADVDAQAGAYATGVLALITSATIAVTLSAIRKHQPRAVAGFGIVALIFCYTTGVILISEPDGLKIALSFIAAIVITSLISRVWRTTELRVQEVMIDEDAKRFIAAAAEGGELHIIANHPDERNAREYLLKEREQRAGNNIPHGAPVLFLEVSIRDASDFAPVLHVRGEGIGGYRVLRVEGASVPNSIAAVLLWLRDTTGARPHAYFGWTEGNPLKYLARFILFGEGDIAPLTHEVLRKAEPDPTLRPAIHVG